MDIESEKQMNEPNRTMKKPIPKSLDGLIEDHLLEGAKLFMFQIYGEERAILIEHLHGDVTITSWVDGTEDVSYLNISKDIRNSLANHLAMKEDLT